MTISLLCCRTPNEHVCTHSHIHKETHIHTLKQMPNWQEKSKKNKQNLQRNFSWVKNPAVCILFITALHSSRVCGISSSKLQCITQCLHNCTCTDNTLVAGWTPCEGRVKYSDLFLNKSETRMSALKQDQNT